VPGKVPHPNICLHIHSSSFFYMKCLPLRVSAPSENCCCWFMVDTLVTLSRYFFMTHFRLCSILYFTSNPVICALSAIPLASSLRAWQCSTHSASYGVTQQQKEWWFPSVCLSCSRHWAISLACILYGRHKNLPRPVSLATFQRLGDGGSVKGSTSVRARNVRATLHIRVCL
jgi:hypothetical protein